MPKLVFGSTARRQIAKRVQEYVARNFRTAAKAAVDLGISRWRLASYTSGKVLPGADTIDLMLEKWGLDLLVGQRTQNRSGRKNIRLVESNSDQLSLFDTPMTFKSDEVNVTIKRRGPNLVANIHVSADVRIA